MTAASDAQEGPTQEGRARVGRARETEFEPVYHYYGPHRAGLPALIPYFRELWRRRAFAAEMSRATMRGANTSTFFGQAWLILNPLLLAAVYYILVTIIRRQNDPAFFAHLTLGIFAFQLVGHSITSGATSLRIAACRARARAYVASAIAFEKLPATCTPQGAIGDNASGDSSIGPP